MPPTVSALTLLAIAVGGAAGALARYWVALTAVVLFPRFAPAGTLIVNTVGCLAIGALMVLAQGAVISEWSRQLWVTGFLGALTTFSAFGWQTIELTREGRFVLAAVNVLCNVGLGLGAVGAGLWLGRRWLA